MWSHTCHLLSAWLAPDLLLQSWADLKSLQSIVKQQECVLMDKEGCYDYFSVDLNSVLETSGLKRYSEVYININICIGIIHVTFLYCS